jgi:hypothetical protein
MTLQSNLRGTSGTSHEITVHVPVNRYLNRLSDRELALMSGTRRFLRITI